MPSNPPLLLPTPPRMQAIARTLGRIAAAVAVGTLPLLIAAAVSAEEPGGCAQVIDAATRDECWVGELLATPADRADRLLALAFDIHSPTTRSAAVVKWTTLNHGKLGPQLRDRFCALARDGDEQRTCQRNLQAAHLAP